MRRRVPLALAVGLALLAPAAATASAPTGRLLVTLAAPGDRADAAAAQAVAARAHARSAAAPVPQLRLAVMRPRAGEGLAALAARLRADPAVRRVETERRMELRYDPNDPALVQPEGNGAAAGTVVEWWAVRQGFPAAWEISRGNGATVAVIDTGIDVNHPDLSGRVRESADFDNDPSHGPATGDEIGHGTHVASMACATADNGVGLAGAGFGCDLLAIKTDLSESSVAASIVWAVEHGADAINMSFGTDGSQPAAGAVVDALDYAIEHNVVLVAAAADDPVEEQGDPSNVLQPTGTGGDLNENRGLSVTAANAADQRASFAGRGTQISLAAYGSYGPGGPRGLLGAFPGNTTQLEQGTFVPPQQGCGCRTAFNGDSRYAYLQGTSMAAPMVAATAALMRNLNPDLTSDEVVRIVKESARRPAGTGWNSDLGWGILDAGQALAVARTRDRRAPRSRLRGPATSRTGSFTLRWSGRDPAPPGVRSSGVSRYEIWRSVDGRAARRFRTTRRNSLRLQGRRGSRYAFFTVAIDRAGNREPAPSRPDARVRVAAS